MSKEKPNLPRTAGPNLVPPISDAEWVVMKVVWEKAPLTANQVVAALEGQSVWKPKTIHTLLRRLVNKGVLAFVKQGREYLFRPLVDADTCEHAVTRSFLDRFFDGRIAPFLARFVEKEKLRKDEIARLKRILDGKEL